MALLVAGTAAKEARWGCLAVKMEVTVEVAVHVQVDADVMLGVSVWGGGGCGCGGAGAGGGGVGSGLEGGGAEDVRWCQSCVCQSVAHLLSQYA